MPSEPEDRVELDLLIKAILHAEPDEVVDAFVAHYRQAFAASVKHSFETWRFNRRWETLNGPVNKK